MTFFLLMCIVFFFLSLHPLTLGMSLFALGSASTASMCVWVLAPGGASVNDIIITAKWSLSLLRHHGNAPRCERGPGSNSVS